MPHGGMLSTWEIKANWNLGASLTGRLSVKLSPTVPDPNPICGILGSHSQPGSTIPQADVSRRQNSSAERLEEELWMFSAQSRVYLAETVLTELKAPPIQSLPTESLGLCQWNTCTLVCRTLWRPETANCSCVQPVVKLRVKGYPITFLQHWEDKKRPKTFGNKCWAGKA